MCFCANEQISQEKQGPSWGLYGHVCRTDLFCGCIDTDLFDFCSDHFFFVDLGFRGVVFAICHGSITVLFLFQKHTSS